MVRPRMASAWPWRNRLAKAVSKKMYNFHSTSEDVLRAYDGSECLWSAWLLLRYERYLYFWVLQEKGKGRHDGLGIYPGGMFSDFMGYGYNTKAYSRGRMPTPLEASRIPDAKLRKKPFFFLYHPNTQIGLGLPNFRGIRRDMRKLVGNAAKAGAFLESTLASNKTLSGYYTENLKSQIGV